MLDQLYEVPGAASFIQYFEDRLLEPHVLFEVDVLQTSKRFNGERGLLILLRDGGGFISKDAKREQENRDEEPELIEASGRTNESRRLDAQFPVWRLRIADCGLRITR